jgi:hypothetical protein
VVDAPNGVLAPRWQRWIAMAVTAVVLALLAMLNGQPFYYPDTPTYLRGAETAATKLAGPGRFKPWLPAASSPPAAKSAAAPAQTPSAPSTARASTQENQRSQKALTSVEDKTVLAGRSVYYGALLYLSHLSGSMWWTVAVQALTIAYVLELLLVRLWRLKLALLPLIAAGLVLITPLGIYAGFLMPDVFAGLAILAFATLAVYWRALRSGDRMALSLLLLFSLLGHSSHVALIALMLLVLLVFRGLWPRWRGYSAAALLVAAVCFAGAVAGEWAFSRAVTAATGAPPLRLPHPTGRLIDMGPGTAYLQASCPASGFVVCDYLRNYPTNWSDFLFSSDPAKGTFALVDVAGKRRISEEQNRFILSVLRFDAVGVVSGVAVDFFRQIANFGVDIWGYDNTMLSHFAGRVPDGVFAKMQSTPRQPFNAWLTQATQLAVAVSVALAFYWAIRRRSMAPDPVPDLRGAAGALPEADSAWFSDFSTLVVIGVFANAAVFALIASSLDRFQARVIWLLPLLAIAAILRSLQRAPQARAGLADAERTSGPANRLPAARRAS